MLDLLCRAVACARRTAAGGDFGVVPNRPWHATLPANGVVPGRVSTLTSALAQGACRGRQGGGQVLFLRPPIFTHTGDPFFLQVPFCRKGPPAGRVGRVRPAAGLLSAANVPGLQHSASRRVMLDRLYITLILESTIDWEPFNVHELRQAGFLLRSAAELSSASHPRIWRPESHRVKSTLRLGTISGRLHRCSSLSRMGGLRRDRRAAATRVLSFSPGTRRPPPMASSIVVCKAPSVPLPRRTS